MLRHGRHHLVFMIISLLYLIHDASNYVSKGNGPLHLTELKFKCLLFTTKFLALAISPNLGCTDLSQHLQKRKSFSLFLDSSSAQTTEGWVFPM